MLFREASAICPPAARPLPSSLAPPWERPVWVGLVHSTGTTECMRSRCNRMTGEAEVEAEPAGESGEASLGAGSAVDAPPQPQPQKGWPSKRLPHDTRYFVMKSFSMRDVLISLKKGIWATQHRNEQKLNQAYSVRALWLRCLTLAPLAPLHTARRFLGSCASDAPSVAPRAASAWCSSSRSTRAAPSKATQRWCAAPALGTGRGLTSR